MQNKWGVYGLAVMLGVSGVAPVQAFFNPGRWMDPSEWFGNNNHNDRLPPPRPMLPAYPPAYRQPATYPYPAANPAPAAPTVTTPAAVIAPAPVTVPATTDTTPPASTEYKESDPAFAPSTSNSELKWPDESIAADNPKPDQDKPDQNFSFAPAGYLQDSDNTQ